MSKRMSLWLGAAVVAISGAAFAQSQPAQATHTKEQQKACNDLDQFRTSISKLEQAGPQSTVGEIRTNADQAREDLKALAKTAEKVAKPETENVRKSLERLRDDARNIPDGATVEQAQARIQADVKQVRMASAQLEKKLDCGMGGAGTDGMDATDPGLEPAPQPHQPTPDE